MQFQIVMGVRGGINCFLFNSADPRPEIGSPVISRHALSIFLSSIFLPRKHHKKKVREDQSFKNDCCCRNDLGR